MNGPIWRGESGSSWGKHVRGNRRPKPAPPAALQARWWRAAWTCSNNHLRALGIRGGSFCDGCPGVAVSPEVLQAATSDMVISCFVTKIHPRPYFVAGRYPCSARSCT